MPKPAMARLDREMTEFEQKVLEDLSALKVQMHALMGIGQPGRLYTLEQQVSCHERALQQLKGLSGAFGGTLALLQLIFFLMRGKH